MSTTAVVTPAAQKTVAAKGKKRRRRRTAESRRRRDEHRVQMRYANLSRHVLAARIEHLLWANDSLRCEYNVMSLEAVHDAANSVEAALSETPALHRRCLAQSQKSLLSEMWAAVVRPDDAAAAASALVELTTTATAATYLRSGGVAGDVAGDVAADAAGDAAGDATAAAAAAAAACPRA